jgi:hypothetical protein
VEERSRSAELQLCGIVKMAAPFPCIFYRWPLPRERGVPLTDRNAAFMRQNGAVRLRLGAGQGVALALALRYPSPLPLPPITETGDSLLRNIQERVMVAKWTRALPARSVWALAWQ